MLRIRRSAKDGETVFTLSGRMEEDEEIGELEALIGSEEKGVQIILDLKDLTLVNQEGVNFLERCEEGKITLKNCAAYIREWIRRRRGEGKV